MVAYKKFTKAEREGVVRAITKNVVEKEYKPIMSNVENELTSLFMKDIPNEVFEFEKKYPHLIDKGDETSMCDNIEKLRAEYNKVVDNKKVEKK